MVYKMFQFYSISLISLCVFLVKSDNLVIETNLMPDFADVPCLSNGHIGFNVTDSSILLNGLYNGERGQSHRAKIPNFGNLLVLFPCSPTTCSYRLDMRRGIFEIEMRGDEFNITQQILAHRYYNRAMVTIVRVEKENGREFLFNWTVEQGDNPGIDLDLIKSDKKIINGVEVQVRCYITKVLEDKNYQSIGSKVCTATPSLPSYEVKEGLNYNHYFTVGRTESEVVQELKDIMSDERSMLDKHLNVWEKHWETFGISVDDSKLNQIVHSSVFYLISNLPSEETNLPNDPFYGLSPGGLAKGGVLYRDYQGHSFWDTEMWMHPPILLMNPKWSEDILNYRFNSRQAAWENAKSTGYDGYRFPWESGFTGREVTPDCCPEVVEYQHHVVADIAFAFRSHLAATNDVEWFKNIGCDMAWNTAKFWESRVTFNDTTRFYEIRHVMGPDEDHHDIDNNVYTNVNAAINLYFGDFASCFCKDVLKEVIGDYDGFLKIAERLKLLYDEANDFHPQYENFEDGTMIKQADVVLLGFPLQLPMKESTKRNNLIKYDKLTRENGPAMTWAMHTIGFLDLDDEVEAKKVFERSYSLYTREPFKVWSEVLPGVEGAGNFITGAGGFLQSIFSGYGGVRLHFDYLEISNMHLPPDSNILKFNGITYLGNRFSLEIKKSSSKIVFRTINQEKQIQVTKKSTGIIYRPAVGMEIEINNQDSLKFESSISTFGECKMKETKLGTPGNGTEKIYYSSILVLMLFIIKNII